MSETAQCPNCGGVMIRPVTDIGVGNLPHPYMECVDCLQTVNDPPVEGLLDLEGNEPW